MKEGSFTGQISNLDFANENSSPSKTFNEIDVKNIPTPDQAPERLDFSNIPANVLRSGVIESLMQQNDDLMARLNVSLRRIASLEEKLLDAKTETAQVKAKYDNVNDQMLILREQSRLLAEKIRNAESHFHKENETHIEMKEQIHILEIRYAELFHTSKEQLSQLEKDIAKKERLLRGYKKYRRHIRDLNSKIHAEVRALREKNASQTHVIQDLRNNLNETTNYITTQAKEYKNQNATLASAYEAEVKSHKAEIEMLMQQNSVLGERAKDFERIYSEKVKLENELVIAERRESEIRMQTDAELSDMQKALARYKNDSKTLSLELEAKIKELTEIKTTHAEMTEQNKGHIEQVETLQLLWRDQQTQIEKMNEQKNALQKLNQELSITINEYRREIRELKEKTEALEQRNYELTHIEAAKKKAVAAASNSTPSATNDKTLVIKKEDTVTPEIISKIDKVLNDLHVSR